MKGFIIGAIVAIIAMFIFRFIGISDFLNGWWSSMAYKITQEYVDNKF